MKKYFLAAVVLISTIMPAVIVVQGAVSATSTKAVAKPKVQPYEGVITQFNADNASFVIRLRDGKIITVSNPFAVGAFVSVNGTLDPKKNLIPDSTQITLKNISAADAIPIISQVDPGSGTIGTRMTITGSGFTKKGNNINFGGVPNVIPNLPSPDGKMLFFTIPQRAPRRE
jgi:hypothetical protein